MFLHHVPDSAQVWVCACKTEIKLLKTVLSLATFNDSFYSISFFLMRIVTHFQLFS